MDKILLAVGAVSGAVTAAFVYGLVTEDGDKTGLWWGFWIALGLTILIYAAYGWFFGRGTGEARLVIEDSPVADGGAMSQVAKAKTVQTAGGGDGSETNQAGRDIGHRNTAGRDAYQAAGDMHIHQAAEPPTAKPEPSIAASLVKAVPIIEPRDDESGWAHLFVRNQGDQTDFKIQIDSLSGTDTVERPYPAPWREDKSEWRSLAMGECATANVASEASNEAFTEAGTNRAMELSLRLAKAQGGAPGIAIVRFHSANKNSAGYFDRWLLWGDSVTVGISLLRRGLPPIVKSFVVGMSDEGALYFVEADARPSTAIADLNRLIEDGNELIEAVFRSGGDVSSEELWRIQCEGAISKHGTPSHMTDFKIARQPEKQRFQGKGLSGSNLWDRVKRTDAQLEVLRRCRDSIESA